MRSQVWAVVVGINDYPGARNLKYAVNDARGFASYLTEQVGVPSDHVFLLTDAQATLSISGPAASKVTIFNPGRRKYGLAVVLPLFFGGPVDAAAGSPQLRIVSFNVQASNPAKPEVMDYLRDSDADLVFLLESSIDWEDAISRAALPFTMVAGPPFDRTYGITALARDDVAARVVRLGLTDEPGVEVTTNLGGRSIQVLAIHPLSPTSSNRSGGRDAVIQSAAIWARSRTVPVVVVGDLPDQSPHGSAADGALDAGAPGGRRRPAPPPGDLRGLHPHGLHRRHRHVHGDAPALRHADHDRACCPGPQHVHAAG